MRKTLGLWLVTLLLPLTYFAQGVSCPAVVAGPDTTLGCNSCVRLKATPVSGFTTTDYTVQSIPYNPYPYNAGTPILVNIDDVWGSALPIGFNFCFYGNSYTQCVVGSNGVVSFDLTYANQYCAWPISQGIPGNTDVLNSILGPFHDIDPSVGGSIYWTMYGQAPCRVFVVSFFQIPMFSCNNVIATQQIALYETTNIIEVYIQNRPSCPGWNGDAAIEGIQNATGAQAVSVAGRNYPTVWTASNDAYAFVPAGAPNYAVTWYEVGNPTPLTTLDTITVCPSANTDYMAEVVYTNCNGATVTVRDTANIIVSGGTSNLVLTTSQTNPSCAGGNNGTASVSYTGNVTPVTIAWSNGPTTTSVSGLAAGTYTVTVTEASGCGATASITILDPPGMTLTMSNTPALCNGASSGTATVVAANGVGALTYAWSNGGSTSTINGLPAGSYTVTVTDANGCSATGSTTVTQPVPVVVTVASTNPLCAGAATGTATATGSAGVAPYTYTWSNGATGATATGLVAGSYTVTATDANGCTATRTFSIVDPPAVTAAAAATDVICFQGNNGTATVVPGGGTPPYTYHWSTGSTAQSIANLGAGTYTVTVTDANGCTATSSATVSEPAAIQLSIEGDSVLCEYENVELNGIVQGGVGPYLYHWISIPTAVNDSNPTLIYTASDTRDYVLTITDQNGCTATSTYDVVSIDAPIVGFYPDRTEACDSATIFFTNTTTPAGCAYVWEFSDGGTSFYGNTTHFFGNGIWSVGLTATNGDGCTSHMFAQDLITILPTPEASFVSDPNITLLDHRLLSQATFTFNNTSPWYATAVDWDFGDGDSAFVGQVTHTFLDSGYYCIRMNAYNDFGCHDDTTQCIRIILDPFLWVPTGFTPNGDGLNDLFVIGGLEIVDFHIEIYDRWGKLIFKSDSMTDSWDGKALGDAAQEGAYVFKINATNVLGQKANRSGTVTLVR